MHRQPLARVLVVDDNAEMLQIVTKTLSRVGIATTIAQSGDAALALVAKTPFDLILLDNNMPGLTGMEVCQQLKANPQWWAIPIVFITANSSHPFRAEAQRLGAVDVLAKPFDMLALLKVTLTALKRPVVPEATLDELLRLYAPPQA